MLSCEDMELYGMKRQSLIGPSGITSVLCLLTHCCSCSDPSAHISSCSQTGPVKMATTAPPEGVHHYASAADVPFEISKYWHQRYNIFSKFDDGIWMTDDTWFGVTPEPVAT